jgi:acylglycerol lipase
MFGGARVLAAALAVVVAACAPTVQRAEKVSAGFQGPRLTENGFVSFDGAFLAKQSWAPAAGAPVTAAIVALHGMNDYSEAYYTAGPYWAGRGIAVYAYDARGFGKSPNRGVWAGEKLLTEDLRTLVALVRRAHPGVPVAVVGDSMGGATAIAAFGSDRPPDADRLILVAPAVWGWSSLPDLYAASLWLGAHTLPHRPVTAPRRVQRKIQASDNIEMLRKIGRDPHMVFQTRIDAIYGLVGLMETASRRTANLQVPTLFLYGAKDQIIPRPSAEAAARRLPAGARTALYANGYHMLLRDLQAKTVWADVAAFVVDPTAPLPSQAPPLIAGPGATAEKSLTTTR